MVRKVDASGEALRGERRIDGGEAAIVKRMFQSSHRAALQDDRPSPEQRKSSRSRRQELGPSTIYGNWRRGTGIFDNELYVGRLVSKWQQFIKVQIAEGRQARFDPEDQWMMEEVPHLRMIDDQSRARSRSASTGPGLAS